MATRALAGLTARQKIWALAGGLALVAILIGTALALGITGGFKSGAVLPQAGSEAPTNPVGPLPPPVGRAAPRIVKPAPPPLPAPAIADEAPQTAPVEDEDADRIAGAIARTARKALRRGEPVRWHKAGEEGYVSVGEPSFAGGRMCRTVTAVILTDSGERQSGTHLWCALDEDGDDWAPAR
jgi:hypothetical protein